MTGGRRPADEARRNVQRVIGPRARASLTAPALLAVLSLAACATDASPVAPSAPGPSASSAAWPRIPGRVVASSSPAGEQVVRIAVQDPDAAYAEARRLLVDAGFMLTMDRPADGGGTGQACTPALCVGFDVTDDPDFGPSVRYEAFHSTGVVPL